MHTARLWQRISPSLLQVLPRAAQEEPRLWLSFHFYPFVDYQSVCDCGFLISVRCMAYEATELIAMPQ